MERESESQSLPAINQSANYKSIASIEHYLIVI